MTLRATSGGESSAPEKERLETEDRELAFSAAQPRAERLDRLLRQQEELAAFSRERLKQAVLDGLCFVDGEPCADPSRKIRPGQRIVFFIQEQRAELVPSHAPVDVVYADEDIAVVAKPAGLTVHPCPSCKEETLIHRLLGRFPKLAEQGGLRPGIVHRLDKDTSGLMLVALSERARLKLVRDFTERKVHKTYLALVSSVPPVHGQCTEPIGRHARCKVKMAVTRSGREALTEWTRLYASENGRFSLLALRPHTGRTHQIRVHMRHEGYPLLGDTLYGAPRQRDTWKDPAPRQMLHAWRLAFSHPVTEEKLAFACPPPEDFWESARLLRRRMTRLILTGCPGCGKSAFLHALETKGVPVWSSDAEVKRLYAPGGEVASMLNMRYGKRFLSEDGGVSKAALAQAMKKEPGFRASLEGIVHPLVGASREAFFARNEAAGCLLAAAEVPLWFETLAARTKTAYPAAGPTCVVGVHCDQEIRYKRLAEIRGWTPETIAAIDSWQWPEQKKMAACDRVADNSGSLEALRETAALMIQDIRADMAETEKRWLADLQKRLENYPWNTAGEPA